ncbi:MAG: phosphoribosylformylglycinamidine synthase subunit PurS [Saprospiraceae bacterium]|nr:phosphoribosylformylglycinamidine synthase subunit PurS [Saprospiraceae bacterium]
MKFLAEIDVMPHKELLDPQGKTVALNLKNIDVYDVEDVRIGKHIEMTLEAHDETEAENKVDLACKKLLSNVIMETYTFTIKSL